MITLIGLVKNLTYKVENLKSKAESAKTVVIKKHDTDDDDQDDTLSEASKALNLKSNIN